MSSQKPLSNRLGATDWQGGRKITRREFLELSSLVTGSSLLSFAAGCSLPRIVPGPTKSTLESMPISVPVSGNKSTAVKPNIVLIIVDALRPDHTSAAGYSRPTTPNLDAWLANQGATFRDAATTAPWTFPANAAMMTGYQPANLGVPWFGPHSRLPEHIPTLAEQLLAAGYYTAAFVSAPYMGSRWGFARGFNHFDESVVLAHPTTQDSGLAQEIKTVTLDWVNTHAFGQKPLFLLLYFFDPHSWYNPPSPYDQAYDPGYTGTLALPGNFRDGQAVVAGTSVLAPEDVAHVLALYDGEINYWDNQLGEVLTALQTQQILDNALLVVTSDHGDMFGEHGKWNHTNCLYEEVLRVPLLMRYSGVITPGQVINTPVHNMDVMPTLLDYAGLPIPADLQAVSLRSLIEGGMATPRDLFCELDGVTDPAHPFYWIAPHHNLRSVRRGEWKFIEHMRHPEADELYHLNSQSLYEADNQILSEPARAQELRQAIRDAFPRNLFLPYIVR